MSTRCNIEFYEYFADSTELGEPAARIYQHSDGYPGTGRKNDGVLFQLKQLERACKKGFGMYGQRMNDPEWAAAEFISMYRTIGGGNQYVCQHNHGDIEYLYRVVCKRDKWDVLVFVPEHNAQYDITGYKPWERRKLA